MKPRTVTDKWSRKQKNCTKIVAAHPSSHFPVDERVFMVLKYTETSNVLETIRRFQRQFPNQRTPYRETIMDNYNKFVQYGLSLNRNVGNSGRSCSQTAFETFWLFPEHYRFTLHFKTIFRPIHLLKSVVLDVMCTSHLRTVLLLSTPFVCSSSWFHLS